MPSIYLHPIILGLLAPGHLVVLHGRRQQEGDGAHEDEDNEDDIDRTVKRHGYKIGPRRYSVYARKNKTN